MEETVTVSAGTPLVDVTSKEIGGNITSETLVKLPSVNGNFIGFIGLLPGIVPSISTESFGSDSISVNGQDPRNNNYTVDGGNNNDDVIGQRAGMQARTPIEAIQEFQVITGQYDAEFGRTTGAVVNAVIKSGTNVVHGSAFGYFQDSSLTTKDFLAKQRNLRQGRHQLPALGRHHRRADRQGQDALLRQPRAVLDRSRQHHRDPDASRPERPADDARTASGTPSSAATTSCRPQPHLQRALAARAVAAGEPDHPDGVGSASLVPTGRAAREESDVDQTLAVNLNSVLSNTKVNTLRVTWTRENVTFAQRLLQRATTATCSRARSTLAYQTFIDQQDNTGQFRINDGIAVRRHAGLVPAGQARRSRHQGRRAVRLLRRPEQQPGQPERHVRVRPERRRFQSRPIPRTYPDRLTHPRRRPEPVLPEGDTTSRASCRTSGG